MSDRNKANIQVSPRCNMAGDKGYPSARDHMRLYRDTNALLLSIFYSNLTYRSREFKILLHLRKITLDF